MSALRLNVIELFPNVSWNSSNVFCQKEYSHLQILVWETKILAQPSKTQVTDRILTLTPIHASVYLSDSPNSLTSMEVMHLGITLFDLDIIFPFVEKLCNCTIVYCSNLSYITPNLQFPNVCFGPYKLWTLAHMAGFLSQGFPSQGEHVVYRHSVRLSPKVLQ